MSRGLSFGVLLVLFALVAIMAHRVNAPYRPPEPPKPPPVTETAKDGMTAPPGMSGEKEKPPAAPTVSRKPQAIVKPNETADPPPKPKVMDSAAVLRQKLQSGQMYLESDWAAMRKPGQAGIDEIRRIAEEERKKELAKTGGKPQSPVIPESQRSRLTAPAMEPGAMPKDSHGHSKDDGHGH